MWDTKDQHTHPITLLSRKALLIRTETEKNPEKKVPGKQPVREVAKDIERMARNRRSTRNAEKE